MKWCFLLFFISVSTVAQDSIVLESSISEKKRIQFEEHFFDAITEKAINNHEKAIQNLEECNRIIPDNKAVLFELSKNYSFLNRLPEALEYGKQALALDQDNLWILEHLVTVYKKSRNFDEAIALQLRISKNYPKKKRALVFLHLQNNNRNAAIQVLNELSDAKLLDARLRALKQRMTAVPKPTPLVTQKKEPSQDLKQVFEKEKSFKVLNALLLELDKENNPLLLNYSEQGMALFPAQPIVYLMNGKALNKKKAFKKAIESLENGIDFVIDDKPLENRFYMELIKAYKALGDMDNVNKYQKKRK